MAKASGTRRTTALTPFDRMVNRIAKQRGMRPDMVRIIALREAARQAGGLVAPARRNHPTPYIPNEEETNVVNP